MEPTVQPGLAAIGRRQISFGFLATAARLRGGSVSVAVNRAGNGMSMARSAKAGDTAAERVEKTFHRWKRHRLPDKTAFYHTGLDIAYRRGGLPERIALLRLRYRRSDWRRNVLLLRVEIVQLFKLAGRLRP
jgi:hypothetical protein